MNRLVRHNLVRGLPSKCFDNDHTIVACLKGKQHKASCKTKLVNSVTKPLHTLHMDLFCPTSVSSLNHKWYCLVVTNDFSRFTWTLFLKTKDETSGILRNFITEIENLKDLKAEAVNTDCYVQNKVLFDAKGDEGYFIGYSMSSKAFRVFNKRTKRVEENLHVEFLENKAIEKGAGRNWLFDIDSLTNSMNCVLVVVAGTNSTNFLGTKEVAGQDVKKDVSSLRYIALLNWFHEAHLESSTSNAQDACNADALESSGNSNPTTTLTNPSADHMETLAVETPILIVSSPISTACINDSPELLSDTRLISKRVTSQDDTPSLDNILTLTNRFENILGVTTNSNETNGVKANLGNKENNISASPTPTFRIHKDHPKSQIIGHVDTPGNSQINIDDKGYWDSGCSRHMTGNISYLSDYEPFDGGYVSFGQGGCKITGKGTIKTGKLEFENVYFVKDLKYNLFSVSQICDNKNNVLFTDSECIVLGQNFNLTDDTNVLLKTPRQHNMYSIDLNNIVHYKDLTCLVAKASADE
nr:ribonuclease H-like domain-containing protein [Tanacetum cinerariifolium]